MRCEKLAMLVAILGVLVLAARLSRSRPTTTQLTAPGTRARRTRGARVQECTPTPRATWSRSIRTRYLPTRRWRRTLG